MIEALLNPALASVILRVVVGFLFILHGYPKLFKNYSSLAGWFDSLGLKPGKFWALVAGLVEFGGGILLILGLWVQVVGILLAIQMLVAMAKVKWGKVGLLDQGGWELDFVYFAIGITFALMGGGAWSLDAYWWGS